MEESVTNGSEIAGGIQLEKLIEYCVVIEGSGYSRSTRWQSALLDPVKVALIERRPLYLCCFMYRTPLMIFLFFAPESLWWKRSDLASVLDLPSCSIPLNISP